MIKLLVLIAMLLFSGTADAQRRGGLSDADASRLADATRKDTEEQILDGTRAPRERIRQTKTGLSGIIAEAAEQTERDDRDARGGAVNDVDCYPLTDEAGAAIGASACDLFAPQVSK